jgi:hypothetical protein
MQVLDNMLSEKLRIAILKTFKHSSRKLSLWKQKIVQASPEHLYSVKNQRFINSKKLNANEYYNELIDSQVCYLE